MPVEKIPYKMKFVLAIVALAVAVLAVPDDAADEARKRCQPGAYRCDGKEIEVCSTQRQWVVSLGRLRCCRSFPRLTLLSVQRQMPPWLPCPRRPPAALRVKGRRQVTPSRDQLEEDAPGCHSHSF